MLTTHASVTDLRQSLVALLHGDVQDVALLGRRAAHTMYTAVWTSSGTSTPTGIIIRFFEGPRAAEEMRTEANALRDLYRTGFPVPELFAQADESATSGLPFIVMERLPGQPLGQLALADRTRIPYWLDQASSLMLRLHSLRWESSFDWLQPPLAPLDFADRQLKWWSRKAQSCGATDAGPGFAWLRQNMHKARRARTLALVHRDLHPDNLLATDDRITGVLDWGELTIADPAVDVGWSRMILTGEVGAALGDAFAEYYLRRNPAVAESLVFWEVFAACKRLTALAQHVAQVGDDDETHTTMQQAIRDFMAQRLTDDE